ncbi:MAG: hypothetical protein SCM11_12890 [Bacillota bacterium]|nr:hypothetical protein [Bacillota bacterium]
MKLSYRITQEGYPGGASFDELLSLFDQHLTCVDEVAIFEQYAVQGYYSLHEVKNRCVCLRDCMATLRKHNIPSVGINVLVTLGHADDSAFAEKPPFQTMVDHDGTVTTSCMCPNSPEFEQHTKEKYRMFAELKPDFIWIDDDIRMHNHGSVRYACFCPICLSLFNKTHQTALSREDLVSLLNAPDGSQYRGWWVKHNSDSINRLLLLIEQTIHDVNPAIEIGLMTIGGTTYSGQDYTRWFTSLQAVKGRPGGGFYTDDTPLGFLKKTYSTARQVATYPTSVTDIQYELENYPYQRLQKSITMMILECASNLTCSVNGIALNALHTDSQMNKNIMAQINRYSGMFQEIENTVRGFVNPGLYPAFPMQYEASRSVENENWFGKSGTLHSAGNAYVLGYIGIPLAMNGTDASGVVLTGHIAHAYSQDELLVMLSGGVLMDADALRIMEQRGLAQYCGVKTADRYDFNVYERYTDDPLNGQYAGILCNTTGLLASGHYHTVLKPLYGKVRILNTLEAIGDRPLGPVMTAFENSLGGRIVVNGYMPWNHLYSVDKIEQMRNVCDWITRDMMPARIYGNVKVVPLLRVSADRKHFLLMLTNTMLDHTGGFKVEIKLPKLCSPYCLAEDGSHIPIPPDDLQKDSGKTIINIHDMTPWQFIIIAS